MLNNMKKTALAALIIASGINTAAAESVQVNVIGTIIPAACTPSVAGGGIIDYGNIKADTLSADDYTSLKQMQLGFEIQCDAPARIALHAVSDRPGTLAGGTEESYGVGVIPIKTFNGAQANWGGAGLGLDNNTPIGGYAMAILQGTVTADDNNVTSIFVENDKGIGQWNRSTTGSVLSPRPRAVSWAAEGELTPVAFTKLNGTLAVEAYINKASELDLTHAIHLDGQTTLEVVYL